MELALLLLMDSPRSRRHRIRPKGGYRWPATHRVDAVGSDGRGPLRRVASMTPAPGSWPLSPTHG